MMSKQAKKQKVDDDKETTELKRLIEIIPKEEEVAIDAILLAVRTLIITWKIHKEGEKSYYQIQRAGGKTQTYLVFGHMLRTFDKEDLEDLWKLVKAKYGSTRPVEDYDLVLWNDLKNMFKPNIEDTIWRRQDGYKVIEWRLYDSCGVQFLRMQSVQIFMLVEKTYPLTPPTLTIMLNRKLKSDHYNEILLLLKFKLLLLLKDSTIDDLQGKDTKCAASEKLMLPEEVTTASASYNYLKIRVNAARRLQLSEFVFIYDKYRKDS
ncbi:hypothetical protein Tco_1279874 [Tanacetum coccineum]